MNRSTLDVGYIDLKVEKVAAQMGVSRRALTLSSDEDFLTNQVLYRLVRMVATVPGEEEIRVPATWWDALKESEVRRSPIMRWWVARRPVEYKVWRAMEVLPNFPELDRYRDTVRIVRLLEVPDWKVDFESDG